MQAPEEPAPSRQALTLPPPEHFGITTAVTPSEPAARLDWNLAKQEMERLGVVGYHCARLPQGGVRITLVVPLGQGARHVETEAGTEAAAVVAALHHVQALRR